jgi:hypothetical protein
MDFSPDMDCPAWECFFVPGLRGRCCRQPGKTGTKNDAILFSVLRVCLIEEMAVNSNVTSTRRFTIRARA